MDNEEKNISETVVEAVETEAAAVAENAPAEAAPAAEAKQDRPRRGRRERSFKDAQKDESGDEEIVLAINRCSKVVKGGRNFSFGALVIVGDKAGKVGYGYGKANEVSDAIRKGGEAARKNMVVVPIHGSTIPHTVEAKFRGSKVLIRPASEGTGLIAGGTMRAILSLAGVVDVLAKSLGSSNPANVVKATFEAISMLHSKQEVLTKRGKI